MDLNLYDSPLMRRSPLIRRLSSGDSIQVTAIKPTAGDAGNDPFIDAERAKDRPTRNPVEGYDASLTNESDLLCPHTQASSVYADQLPDVQHVVNVVTSHKNTLSLTGRFFASQPFDLQIQQPIVLKSKSDQSIIEVLVDVDGDFASVVGADSIPYRCHCGAEDGHGSSKTPLKFKHMTIRQIRKRSIRIRSAILQEGLRNVFNHYYPGLAWSDEGLVVPEPYGHLLRYYPEMLAIAQRVPCTEDFAGLHSEELTGLLERVGKKDTSGAVKLDDETVRQFALLTKLLKPEYEDFAHTHWKKLIDTDPVISFDGLWLLYRPGADAYFERSGVKFCAVVQSFSYEQTGDKYSDRYAKIECWMLASKGERIVRRQKTFTVAKYQSDKSIVELDLKVLKYISTANRQSLRTELQNRGRFTYSLLRDTGREMQYDGVTTNNTYSLTDLATKKEDHRSDSDDVELDSKTISLRDRVIVDHKMCLKQELIMPGSRCSDLDELPWYSTSKGRPPVPYKSYRGIDIDNTPSLTDHQYMLLHPELACFMPNTKEWKWLSADFLSEVKRVEDATKNLVLDGDHLKMIRAMSEQHLSDFTSWGADFIPGKGIGQTVLLHGPPGVGKTYTVECIAEEFERPLLSLSPPDLGTSEYELESKLTDWFKLAARWSAILLIDEADVFLERRKQADIERNGLVTVFLRQLEYFQGLLFVTTNRVGHIDDAFMSRVQVAIKYPRLNGEDRSRIWKAFFDKLEEEQDGHFTVTTSARDFVLDPKKLSKSAWNGRNIRNALQTAMRLAAYDSKSVSRNARGGKKGAIPIKAKHFEDVMKMSQDFHDYLDSIYDADEETRANRRHDL